ncbi:tetraspanin-33 isoform X3 [Ictalurus furcatus]|nr:tetraspanin-33 isoform X3 [Ictalurus furcatus]XP_053491073.1 tetraspanin-33 isoform X3 [Ictalurus furcatus]XP_053491074.1 tetraspanin-33 isoform X3 [Ictalurus furcatus]XP_053491075.1 tetraspanin-33 isoform X3 [Ictalurus furcatus]
MIAVGIYAKVAKENGTELPLSHELPFSTCYIHGVLLELSLQKISCFTDVVDTLATDPALLLLTVGSLTFIITFFGCFGALRDGAILLKMFLGILMVILFLQIAAAVLGFLFSDMVLKRTELLMKKAIVLYREDMDLENVIDFVQKKFLCCGVNYYSDWSQNAYFNCSVNNPSLEACGVPFSCCVRQQNETVFNSMCGYKTQGMEESLIKQRIYVNGCLNKIVLWGKQNLLLVGGISIGLLCLEICMISLAAAQLIQIQKKGEEKSKSQAKQEVD